MTAAELQRKAEQLQAIERALVAQYGSGQASYDPDSGDIEVLVARRPLSIKGKFDANRQEISWDYWFVDPVHDGDLPIQSHSHATLNAATTETPAQEPEPDHDSPAIIGRDEGAASIYAYADAGGWVRIELPCYLRTIQLSVNDVKTIAKLSGGAS